MDPMAVRYDLLNLLLPTVLFSLLAIVVAAVGVSRWQSTMLVIVLIGLVLLVVGGFLYQNPISATPQTALADTIDSQRELLAESALRNGIVFSTIGAFYALIVASSTRSWGWFIVLAVAAAIGALAGAVLLIPTLFFDFFSDQQAHAVTSAPGYVPIASVATGLPLVVMALYALTASRSSRATTRSTTSMSDDITLP
jgi:hypothetical protein